MLSDFGVSMLVEELDVEKFKGWSISIPLRTWMRECYTLPVPD